MRTTEVRETHNELQIPAIGPDLGRARLLAEAYAPTAYVYFQLGSADNLDERDIRLRHLQDGLREAGAPEAVRDAVASRIAAEPASPAAIALFLDTAGELIGEQLMTGAVVGDQCGYASPPLLTPLLRWEQDRPPYVAVAIDRTGADLTFSTGGGAPVGHDTIIGTEDEIERNAPGGWAQPRYQQRAEDSWRHNAGQVAEAVAARIASVKAQALLLSGDVRALQYLQERLGPHPDLVIEQLSGGRTPDGTQAERPAQIDEALRRVAAIQNATVLERLHTHLGPETLAVQGAYDTVDALAGGRVALLVVSDLPVATRTATFGSDGSSIYLDSPLEPGDDVRTAAVTDAAVRSALLTGAGVRVVPAGTAGVPSDGLGALCRYRVAVPEPKLG